MQPSTKAAVKLLVFTGVTLALAALFAWITIGCAPRVARANSPAAVYALSADEYDLAESHFAGALPAAPAVYWTDWRCQDLLDQRDSFALWSGITGGLAGAVGISTALVDSDVPQWCIGAGALVFGSVSAGLAGAATAKTRRFEQYCSAAPAVELAPTPDELTGQDAGAE